MSDKITLQRNNYKEDLPYFPSYTLDKDKENEKYSKNPTSVKDIARRELEGFYKIRIKPVTNTPLIVGDNIYHVPDELFPIRQQIEDATEILNYKYDWDENGAEPTNPKTFSIAIDFLLMYAKYILGKDGKILKTPYIDLTNSGDITIYWDTPNADFLIIFKKENNQQAFFSGKNKTSGVKIISSVISNTRRVQTFLAAWMSENLSDLCQSR